MEASAPWSAQVRAGISACDEKKPCSSASAPGRADYNPTQAGDGTAMSPVTGIFCQGTDSLTLMTMMLDFNHNK